MSDSTPRLNLPLVGDHAQKRIVMNAGLLRLESLVQARALSRATTAQPATPADGDAYILPTGATGAAWTMFATGAFVRYDSLLWEVIPFPDGAVVHVADENLFVVRDGAGWAAFEDAMKAFDGLTHLGINTTADATNVLALKGPAALMSGQYAASGGSGDLSLVLNKEADGDTVQLLFQKNWSTRAILGLLGDNNLTLKVSSDGATFTTALGVNRTTGAATLVSAALANGSAATPALALNGNYGLFYDAANSALGFAVNGTQTGYLGASGLKVDIAGGGTHLLQIQGESATSFVANRHSANVTPPQFAMSKARGTIASPAVPQNGDNLGIVNFRAFTSGTTFSPAANLQVACIETATVDSTHLGARFTLSVCPVGSGTLTEMMRIDAANGWQMGGANIVVDANRNVRARVYTVATLPAASAAAGQRAQVSDASSPVFAAAVSGGGSTHCPVYSDGSAWRCG